MSAWFKNNTQRLQKQSVVCILLIACATIAGCQSEPKGGSLHLEVDANNATKLIQHINGAAQRCWGKDKAFNAYHLVPEIDTQAGNPRILILPARHATGLPKLVIEAQGKPPKLITYGPLARKPLSNRINDDLIKWSAGSQKC